MIGSRYGSSVSSGDTSFVSSSRDSSSVSSSRNGSSMIGSRYGSFRSEVVFILGSIGKVRIGDQGGHHRSISCFNRGSSSHDGSSSSYNRDSSNISLDMVYGQIAGTNPETKR